VEIGLTQTKKREYEKEGDIENVYVAGEGLVSSRAVKRG